MKGLSKGRYDETFAGEDALQQRTLIRPVCAYITCSLQFLVFTAQMLLLSKNSQNNICAQ